MNSDINDDIPSDRKMKICLLIDAPYDPAYPSRTEVTNIFGKYFPSFGHDITWVVTSIEDNSTIQEISYNQVKICNITRSRDSAIYFKIFNIIAHRIRKYQYLKKRFDNEKYDLIGVRNNVFDGLFAIYIKHRYGIPFVFQYSSPIMKLKQSQSIILLKISDFGSIFVMKKADLIFTTSSKYLGDYLINKGISKSKILAISNCAERHCVSKEDVKTIKKELGVEGNNIIFYTGTLDKVRSLEIMIYAFSKIKLHHPNSKLLIVGEGDGKTNLMNLASKIKMEDDIIFTGKVTYNEVPKYIEISDICISPIPPLDFYKISSPLKVYEYMAMGKPIVANEEIPDHKDSIMDSNAGILVPYDSDSFAKAIMHLLDNPEIALNMGINGKAWSLTNANYKKASEKLEIAFQKLISNSKKKLK